MRPTGRPSYQARTFPFDTDSGLVRIAIGGMNR
jgi:hypothetical protein